MKEFRQRGKLNNKGLSFVEIIVVIAILGVLVGLASTGVYTLISADSKKASKNLYQQISLLRTYTLSKEGDWQGVLTRESGNGSYLYEIKRTTASGTETISTEKLGSRITISCDSTVVSDSNPIVFEFRRGTGAVKTVGTNSTSDVSIVVSTASGSSYNLKLWNKTGKISTDY